MKAPTLSIFLFAALLVFSSQWSSAQSSLSLVDPSQPNYLVVYTCGDPEAGFSAKLTNTGQDTVYATLIKEDISIAPNHQSYFVWNGLAYTPTTNQPPASQAVALAPGDTTDVMENFSARMALNGVGGTDVVKYCFHDAADITDSICINITYMCPNGFEELDLGSIISNLFPNPASDLVSLNYQLSSLSGSATAEVFDLQGRLLLNTTLNSLEATKEIDISNLGQGFYTMLIKVDGKPVDYQTFSVIR